MNSLHIVTMNKQMEQIHNQYSIINYYLISLKAYCPQGCQYGDCTAPNTCTCQSGWTGDSCNIGKITLIIIIMLYRILITVVKLYNYNN